VGRRELECDLRIQGLLDVAGRRSAAPMIGDEQTRSRGEAESDDRLEPDTDVLPM
jgi:hypothetical protein